MKPLASNALHSLKSTTLKYFNQPVQTQCAGEVNEWQWISSKYKKDNQCVAYMKGSKRSFTLFGKDGVENIFNEEDFALLQENKLAPSERRWCTSW
ncbi:hypothetical protein L596_030465 [Steinernema carpocapsae]|uniref:Uncharacterized protein n=1 Tax=Steinernema carpocapsae TaxID=34508 RepID=A0A4U5LPH0_STECR|nr:hypothetical protein L596_030465 [Steinernema carpocapsae]